MTLFISDSLIQIFIYWSDMAFLLFFVTYSSDSLPRGSLILRMKLAAFVFMHGRKFYLKRFTQKLQLIVLVSYIRPDKVKMTHDRYFNRWQICHTLFFMLAFLIIISAIWLHLLSFNFVFCIVVTVNNKVSPKSSTWCRYEWVSRVGPCVFTDSRLSFSPCF